MPTPKTKTTAPYRRSDEETAFLIEWSVSLGGRREQMIFFRADGWYPVQGVLDIPLVKQAAEHAELNPGTLRIEDIDGVVLWRLQ